MSKIIAGIYLLYVDFIFVIFSAISLDITKFKITTNFNNTRQDKNGK